MTQTRLTTTHNSKTAKETPEQMAARIALEDMIAEQVTDRVFAKKTIDELIPTLEKEVTYVSASNGLFKVTKKPIGLFIEQLQAFEAKVPGVGPLEAGVHLTVPKIPAKYLIKILSWYRDVNTRDHTEASNLFFWNHNNIELPTQYTDNTPIKGLEVDGQLVMYCPKQTNSSTLSEFGADSMVKWLRDNMSLYLEIHSHNTMGAFFSGTDDANENMTQFYAVWGQVTQAKPAFIMRYVVGKTRVLVPMSYVFDIPRVQCVSRLVTDFTLEGDLNLIADGFAPPAQEAGEESVSIVDYAGPWPQLEYSPEWMEQHTKKSYAAPANTWGGTANGGRNKRWDYNLGRYVYDNPSATTSPTLKPIQRANETIAEYEVRLSLWEEEEDIRLGKSQENLAKGKADAGAASKAYDGFSDDYIYQPELPIHGDDSTGFDQTEEVTLDLRFQNDSEGTPAVQEALVEVFESLTEAMYHFDIIRYQTDASELM